VPRKPRPGPPGPTDEPIIGEFRIITTRDKGSNRAGNGRGQRDRIKAEANRKLRLVIQARLEMGLSWERCAEYAGYSNSGTAFRRFHDWLGKQPVEDVAGIRRTLTGRLDRLLEAVLPMAVLGHGPSVDRVLAIEASRLKVLGLDKAPPDDRPEADAEVLALARRYSALSPEEVGAEVRRLDWVVMPGEEAAG
jgi:hypothetical protein